MRRYLLITVAVLIVAFGVGAGIALLESPRFVSDGKDENGLLKPALTLPDYAFEDIQGKLRNSGEWSDKVVVLNFWATWCPPCRAETPGFVALQEALGPQGVQFVGIAIDEKEAVAEFVEQFKVNYPALLGDRTAMLLSKQLGNRFEGLPFTVVVDRDGYLRHRQAGEMPQERLEQIVRSLL